MRSFSYQTNTDCEDRAVTIGDSTICVDDAKYDRRSVPAWTNTQSKLTHVPVISLTYFDRCLRCPRGYFKNTLAGSQCTECPSGFIQPKTGEKACSPCAPGMHGIGNQVCASCPQEGIREMGQTDCPTCGVENATVSNRITCSACAKGLYSGEASSNCMHCPVGFVSNAFRNYVWNAHLVSLEHTRWVKIVARHVQEDSTAAYRQRQSARRALWDILPTVKPHLSARAARVMEILH